MQVKYVSLLPNLVKMSERMSAVVSEGNARLQNWLFPKAQVILVTDEPLLQLDCCLQSFRFLHVDLHSSKMR